MVDCSHGNSNKDHERQPMVMQEVLDQIIAGDGSNSGVMIESNLESGNQPIPTDLSQLKYGISITDKCIDWKTTEETLRKAHGQLKAAGGRRTQ
jgi:3-deoxy-7-phosphoheptulonate synthase